MGSGVSVLVCGLSGGFQRLGVELLRHEFWEKAHEDRALCHGLFGDEDDTVLASETRPLFERHYPGMSGSFPGGHRLNAHVVVHTLLPCIRGLNLF